MNGDPDHIEPDDETTAPQKNRKLADLLLADWLNENIKSVWRIEPTDTQKGGWAVKFG